jgi:alpha-galactosidase
VTGGAVGAGAGGEGAAGAGGSAPQCDTTWDSYPSKEDGLALTPPMGWNSWNVFHENINETQIREIAAAMVSSGMRDAGYQYLNLDDRWMDDDGRDSNGNLVADNVRFPSGIAALADHVHGLGLKLGLYGDRGTRTCANVAESGSYGNETRDAETFASWGVDYLKFDNCNLLAERDNEQAKRQDYERMFAALQASGHPIVFSICAWDARDWMPNAGHLWRSTFDIGPCWDCDEWYRSIVEIIDENNETANYAGPGHWNDPDMLEVGNAGLSDTEATAHFSMWALMAAPLIAGNDLRSMSETTRSILTNTEVIAVNQDPAGIQGTRVVDNGDLEVWMKPLCSRDGPEKAVALLNRSGSTATISVSFAAIGLAERATVRDLWAHQDRGEQQGSFSASVPSHGVVMLRITNAGG